MRLHNLNPLGVLHVGTHESEESGEYLANGVKRVFNLTSKTASSSLFGTAF